MISKRTDLTQRRFIALLLKILTPVRYVSTMIEEVVTVLFLLGFASFAEADLIVAHNGISYDTPQIKKHFAWFDHHHQIDTLILSRFFCTNLREVDLKKKYTMMPAKLYGSHSLEAWGYRLKCHKDEFGKQADWGQWSPEMQAYCVQDVTVLVKLWNHFQTYLNPSS